MTNITFNTISEKRNYLRELSARVKEAVSKEHFLNTNLAIIRTFYIDAENKQFMTADQWNALGFYIKKGSKAFMVWGKPQTDAYDKNAKYFPVAFLFSNAQVVKKGEPNNA